MTTFLKTARTGAAFAFLAVAGLATVGTAEAGSSYRDTALINKYIQALDYGHHRGHKRHYGKKRYYGGWRKRHHRKHHYSKRHRSYGYGHRVRRYRDTHDYGAVAPRYNGLRLDVFFKYASAEFTYKAKRALDALGYALTSKKLYNKRFLIEGHTDAHGSQYKNQHLSERRAIAVKRYLARHFDVDPHRLVAIGYGEDRPYHHSDPYAGVNRRVEIKPLPTDTAYDFGPYKRW